MWVWCMVLEQKNHLCAWLAIIATMASCNYRYLLTNCLHGKAAVVIAEVGLFKNIMTSHLLQMWCMVL